MIRIMICLMAAAVPCSATSASEIQLQQFGSVEVWSDSVLVEQEISKELTPLEVAVGHTFNEAYLQVNYPPEHAPNQGLYGQIYVSAVSLPGHGEMFSQVTYHYDFQLDSPTDYAIRYNKRGEADTSFVVANESGDLISLMDAQSLLLHGRFNPGYYRFSIVGSASSSFQESGMVEQDYSQLGFGMLLTEIPEPKSLLLVALGGALLTIARKRPASFRRMGKNIRRPSPFDSRKVFGRLP